MADEIEKPEQQAEPRPIDELLGLPYSEMTEDEIEIVVKYKAEQMAQSEVFRSQIEEVEKSMAAQIKIHQETATHSQNLLDVLTRQALDIYERASNGKA